jgi:hypothetical protein
MNINTNIIDFVWNFKNLKLKDFGLNSEYNMLCAPVCECGCGEKMNVLLESDDDIYDFCYELVDTQDCNYCVAFAINEKNEMLGAIKYDGEIECVGSDGVIEDYADIGLMFDDLELHQYGIIVNVGDGEYKILEE